MQKLLNLEPRTRDELLIGLRAAKPALGNQALASSLKGKVSQLNNEQLEELIDTLISLAYGRMRAEMGVADFVSALVALNDVALPDSGRAEAQRVLEAFLSSPAITVTAKANDVFTEHERIFVGARIVTDLRPVFGDSPSAPPLGAAVVHMLKLSYHSAHDDLDFYVAMDGEDLVKLREVIQRAEAKAQNMRAMLEKVGVSDFEEKSKQK